MTPAVDEKCQRAAEVGREAVVDPWIWIVGRRRNVKRRRSRLELSSKFHLNLIHEHIDLLIAQWTGKWFRERANRDRTVKKSNIGG